MVAIKNILFFVATASALTLGKRDASTILNDISKIDTDVKAVTTAANNYQGGVLGAIPISAASNTLDSAIKNATADAKATPPLTSADSTSISNAVTSLIPDIEASLTALKNKKAQLQNDGLVSLVQGNLQTLKNDTDTFSDALIAIASSDTKAQANSQKTTIDSDFADAINYFSS